MHESITIADVGSIVNVRGSRIATPFGPPSPGKTPTKMPSRSPTSISASVFQVIKTAKPCRRSVTASTLAPEQRFDRSFGHDDVEREVERGKHGEREQEAREERLPPRDSTDEAHESRHQQEARHVQPKPLHRRTEEQRRNKDLRDPPQL